MKRRNWPLVALSLLLGLILSCKPLQSSESCRPPTTPIRYAPERYHHRQTYIVKAEVARGSFLLQIEAPNLRTGTIQYWATGDDGHTWFRARPGASNLGIFGSPFEQAPSNPLVIYRKSQQSGGLYLRSEDGGVTWKLPKYQIAGVSAENSLHSVADGKSSYLSFNLVAIDPTDPLTLYAGTRLVERPDSGGGVKPSGDRYLPFVYVSHDGGETWSRFTGELSSLRPLGISPVNPAVMFGQGPDGIVKSTDSGRHWTPVGQQHGLLAPIGFAGESTVDQQKRERVGKKVLEIRQFAFDPLDADIVYIVSNKGVYRTLDGGKTWCLLDLGFDEVSAVNSMTVNRADPARLYVGTGYGVFLSNDRGCHFQKIYPPKSTASRRD